MKKTFAAIGFAAVLTLTLSGCADETEELSVDVPDKCCAVIECGEVSYSTELCRGEDGFWTVVFTAPQSVSGMVIRTESDRYSAELLGLNQSVAFDGAPAGVLSVVCCLDHAKAGSGLDFDGKERTAAGNASCGEYVLVLDKSGRAAELTVDGAVRAEFSYSE